MVIMLVVFSACDKDEATSPPIPLHADAGINQTTTPFKEITLDGSASEGPDGFLYEWSYSGNVPEDEINFQDITTAHPTFVPPTNDVYTFTLEVISGEDSSKDQVTIITAGAVEIGGTLTENMILTNIQPDAELPDYIVTSDLVVDDGFVLSVADENVRIEFRSGTGIYIKAGGHFTNINEDPQIIAHNVVLYGDNGWKGILVENGKIFLTDAEISNAGAEAFVGLDEAGVIILSGINTSIERVSNNEFINSQSYDILALNQITGSGTVHSNRFSYKHPMKVPIVFLAFFSYNFPNIYPESHEYSILIPNSSGEMDVAHKNMFIFEPGGKFYIDGDFWAGSQIYAEGSTTIYMKEGAAILAEKKILARVTVGSIVFDGLDGAHWKGIASVFKVSNLAVDCQNVVIRNAGYGKIKIGAFEAEAPAALYTAASVGLLQKCSIINSGGYGYYNPSKEETFFELQSTIFKNTAMAAVRTNAMSVGQSFRLGKNNIFELTLGIPAFLVQGDGTPNEYYPWYGLGNDNFYLIDADILDGQRFTLEPGVILKFKAGRSLLRTNPNESLSFRGIANEPIILDGEAGTPGSWGGVYLGGRFGIEHVIIKNGGEFILPGATEKANVVSATPTGSNEFREMLNTTIANSAGYGIVVESGSLDYDFDNPQYNNTFTNNQQGDIIRK